MSDLLSLARERAEQSRIFAAISGGALVLVGILNGRDRTAYATFAGDLNPVLLVAGIALVGLLLMARLMAATSLRVYAPGRDRRWAVIVFLPLALSAGIAFVDAQGVFPEGMNVAFPNALLFYPSMAYVVEVLFHLAPMTLLLAIAGAASRGPVSSRTMLVCIVVVALLEPTFQILGFGLGYPPWAMAYVAANILIINLAQLLLLWKCDFVSMFAFRLVYYLLWHIIWGVLRLELLF